jgi:uncharacterized protein YmfQ (DUF2313 family)
MDLASRYLGRLLSKLPAGDAFRRDVDATLTKAFSATAKEFARVHETLDSLWAEATPWTSELLLPAWERVLALPSTGTLAERRAAVAAKLLDQGGVSIPYYTSLAAALGYDIWIDEYMPAEIGVAVCGDALYGEAWMATWTVHYVSGAQDELIEATLTRARLAHTRVLFESHDYFAIDDDRPRRGGSRSRRRRQRHGEQDEVAALACVHVHPGEAAGGHVMDRDREHRERAPHQGEARGCVRAVRDRPHGRGNWRRRGHLRER